jgi:hypothetical protein
MMTDVTKAADSIWAVAHLGTSSALLFKNISNAVDLAALKALYPSDWLVRHAMQLQPERCWRGRCLAAACRIPHAATCCAACGTCIAAADHGGHPACLLLCRPTMTCCMQRATWWSWTSHCIRASCRRQATGMLWHT